MYTKENIFELRTSHGWHVEISNACESCLSSVHFLKTFFGPAMAGTREISNVCRVMSELAACCSNFFFKLHMAHSHEWHTELLNVCHSWLRAAQIFFNLKEHSTSMNGKCKVKICAIHHCVMFSLKNSGIYTTRKTQAFIQRNTQAFIQKKNCGIYTKKTLRHLYKKNTQAFIQNTLNVLWVLPG